MNDENNRNTPATDLLKPTNVSSSPSDEEIEREAEAWIDDHGLRTYYQYTVYFKESFIDGYTQGREDERLKSDAELERVKNRLTVTLQQYTDTLEQERTRSTALANVLAAVDMWFSNQNRHKADIHIEIRQALNEFFQEVRGDSTK